jgi:quercetin dioxygenase-like cupin family protein
MTQPGADRISQPHPPGSVEHIIVTQGGAGRPADAAEELAAGDYICYPADQPHIFKALEPDTLRCWWRNKTNEDTENHVA